MTLGPRLTVEDSDGQSFNQTSAPVSHPLPAACTHRQSNTLMGRAHNSFTLPHPSWKLTPPRGSKPSSAHRCDRNTQGLMWQCRVNPGVDKVYLHCGQSAAAPALSRGHGERTVIFGLAPIEIVSRRGLRWIILCRGRGERSEIAFIFRLAASPSWALALWRPLSPSPSIRSGSEGLVGGLRGSYSSCDILLVAFTGWAAVNHHNAPSYRKP